MPEQEIEEKFEYEVSTICGYFILVNLFVLVISLFANTSVQVKVCVQLVVAGYYVVSLFIHGIPLSISINPNGGVLTIRSFNLFKIHERVYHYSQFLCTYKDEVGARGIGKSKVFRLTDKSGRNILKIMPNFNGWSSKKLKAIFERLTEKQV